MQLENNPNKQGIKVISRAADILRVLGRETEGLSLGQIAMRVKLPRSTVQRIVSALSDEGFISSEKGYGGIKLGPEIQLLAQASSQDIKKQLLPIMLQISSETGETVDLAVLEVDKMRFLDQVIGSQRLRTVSSIGETFPLTTTANGKAALAVLDLHQAIELIDKEITKRKKTGKSKQTLLAELDAIRTGELARDENEHTEGISALGYAFVGSHGEVYALSTPVPSTRYERVKATLSKSILRSIAKL